MEAASPIPLRRKVAYAVAINVVVFAVLEGLARMLVPASVNARLTSFESLTVSLGIPALNATLRPDHRLFWALRPSLPPVVIDGTVGSRAHLRFTMSTGPDGLRTTPGAASGPPVVALGDSCTFGLGVNDDQSFPSRLASLTGRRVMNAAVPGYTAFQGRRLLENVLESEKPSAVVLTFGWNDASIWDGLSDVEQARRMEKGTSLVLRLRLAQLLYLLLPSPSRTPSTEKPTRPRLLPEELTAEVSAMVSRTRAVGARPIVVVWPAVPHLHGERVPPHHDALRRLAREQGVALLDLYAVLPAHGGDELYLDIVHANARGCQVVAEALAPLLP